MESPQAPSPDGVPDLFRVFPYVAGADSHEPGGALYVPSLGGGRIDNPGVYPVLYLGDSAPGAIAEAFGRFPEWTPSILESAPGAPRSVRAVARYRLPDDAPVCNLDDPERLLSLKLRPSDIVTRDYARSRAWARLIYDQKIWIGIRWWSYYNPTWYSFGLWDTSSLVLATVTPLRLDNPDLLEAGRMIVRRVIASPRK
jgi:hypothetical protein